MSVSNVFLSEFIPDVPPRRVTVDLEHIQIQGVFKGVRTLDVSILVTTNKELAVPALECDHACSRAIDAWLGRDASDDFYPSHLFHWLDPLL